MLMISLDVLLRCQGARERSHSGPAPGTRYNIYVESVIFLILKKSYTDTDTSLLRGPNPRGTPRRGPARGLFFKPVSLIFSLSCCAHIIVCARASLLLDYHSTTYEGTLLDELRTYFPSTLRLYNQLCLLSLEHGPRECVLRACQRPASV